MMISGIAGKMVLKLTNKTISKISNGMYKIYNHQLMTSESHTQEKRTKATKETPKRSRVDYEPER